MISVLQEHLQFYSLSINMTTKGGHKNWIAGKWQGKVGLRQRLLSRQKMLITVRQYCEVCREALDMPYEWIIQQQRKVQSNKDKRDEQGNYTNLIGFLRSPNIIYIYNDERIDQKRMEEIKDAGRRVVGIISYAWDYYFRMVAGYIQKDKGGQRQALAGVYTEENVMAAKGRIEQMLVEIENNKYHWENYVKDVRATQEQQQRQIQQEQTFVKLLQNILQSQTNKILSARRQAQSQQQEIPVQVERQSQPMQKPQQEHIAQEPISLGEVEVEQSRLVKKNLREKIDVEGYFKRKVARLSSKQSKSNNDPIARCEDQRRFNAAALRFFMSEQTRRD